MIANCTRNPALANTRHAPTPRVDATPAPTTAPTGAAPVVAVTITADTLPSIDCGVTACRKVMVVIDQTIGPAPIRK